MYTVTAWMKSGNSLRMPGLKSWAEVQSIKSFHSNKDVKWLHQMIEKEAGFNINLQECEAITWNCVEAKSAGEY